MPNVACELRMPASMLPVKRSGISFLELTSNTPDSLPPNSDGILDLWRVDAEIWLLLKTEKNPIRCEAL